MTTEIVFPDITLPLRDSVRDLFDETRSKVQMETGVTRIRRWNRRAPRVYELAWDMSLEEFQKFDEWYQFTINGGDLPFDIQIQDDLGELGWITAKGVEDYSASCINGLDWMVKWKVRSLEPIFYGRVPTPLGGRASPGMQGYGHLSVTSPLYGTTSVGIVKGSVFVPPGPIAGQSYSGIVDAEGYIYPRPFWGIMIVDVTGTGRFLDLGESELILQFDDVSWTPPSGGDVTLQFDDVLYMPPSVS